jgi:hypothetical protein
VRRRVWHSGYGDKKRRRAQSVLPGKVRLAASWIGHDGWTAEPEQSRSHRAESRGSQDRTDPAAARSRTRAIFRLTAQGTSYDVTLTSA